MGRSRAVYKEVRYLTHYMPPDSLLTAIRHKEGSRKESQWWGRQDNSHVCVLCDWAEELPQNPTGDSKATVRA